MDEVAGPATLTAVAIVIAAAGVLGLAFSIFLIVRAGRIAVSFLDFLGAWTSPAVRGIGVLGVVISGIFLAIGLTNLL